MKRFDRRSVALWLMSGTSVFIVALSIELLRLRAHADQFIDEHEAEIANSLYSCSLVKLERSSSYFPYLDSGSISFRNSMTNNNCEITFGAHSAWLARTEKNVSHYGVEVGSVTIAYTSRILLRVFWQVPFILLLLMFSVGVFFLNQVQLKRYRSDLMRFLDAAETWSAVGSEEALNEYRPLVSNLKSEEIRRIVGTLNVAFEKLQAEQSRARTLEKTAAIARTTQNLAHDVRKPFSMLKMVLDAISSADDPNGSKEIAKASLPEVNQAMASVEGMIQDVMQIGSNSKPNQEVASCEAMLDAAVNELFRIFPEADVGIDYDLNHRHCLFIDTMRVGRVFSNILVNAVQAMNGKGTLWVRTKEERGFVEFRLGNVGSCIPKESLPKLFDAFFTSGKKGGTGLGLAIAQKVVNEHGGSIRCESDKTEKYPAGYVEFILTLPVAEELSPKRDEPLPNHSKVIHEQLLKLKKKDSESGNTDELEQEKIITKRLKTLSGAVPPILIVDDEAVYRNSLAGLLSNFRGGESALSKMPIVFAKSAEEAMQMVKEHSPFLVIQDIDLGVSSKNGIDVIKNLRQEGFKGRICVHSNRFLFDDQKTAFDAGADSVLPKPMSRAHFFKLISSAFPADTGSVPEAHQNQAPTMQKKPRIAYLDDAITFTLSWKRKLKDAFEVETFSSTTKFFKKVSEEKEFLQSLDVVVTDYYFGDDDPLNGKTFAEELRKLGYEKPIFLASNGDFTDDEFKPHLNGVIGKDVPTPEMVMSWIGQTQMH